MIYVISVQKHLKNMEFAVWIKHQTNYGGMLQRQAWKEDYILSKKKTIPRVQEDIISDKINQDNLIKLTKGHKLLIKQSGKSLNSNYSSIFVKKALRKCKGLRY